LSAKNQLLIGIEKLNNINICTSRACLTVTCEECVNNFTEGCSDRRLGDGDFRKIPVNLMPALNQIRI
jgi:hypothetical protein